MNILIAEDNEVNLLLVRSIIENILPTATIIEANNGQVAVEKFISEKPTFIFMDIRMPKKNGYEATAEIRKLETDKHTPIIALTASAAKDEKEKCLNAGMDDYLSKPLVQDSILAILKKWQPTLSQISSPENKLALLDDDRIHFDEAELKNRVSNKTELLKKILDTSKINMDKCVNDLHQQLKNKQFDALKDTAHRLKGMALAATFNKLSKLAAELEEDTENEPTKIADLIDKIESETQLVKRVISN
jgi:CheY-like chemotaxis protein/HPt (histidine-containing phosphotransfer) domain-containing protein